MGDSTPYLVTLFRNRLGHWKSTEHNNRLHINVSLVPFSITRPPCWACASQKKKNGTTTQSRGISHSIHVACLSSFIIINKVQVQVHKIKEQDQEVSTSITDYPYNHYPPANYPIASPKRNKKSKNIKHAGTNCM